MKIVMIVLCLIFALFVTTCLYSTIINVPADQPTIQEGIEAAAEKLAEKRPYVIVGSFVLGMMLTPPDIISQTLLAIPIWLLFELGIIFSRIIGNKKAKEEDDDDNNKATSSTAQSSADHNASEDVDDDEPRYKPMTDEEMEAELDAIEEEEKDEKDEKDTGP